SDAKHIVDAWESAIASPPAQREEPPSVGTVSAIVRRNGRPEDLDGCLRALRRQTRPADQVVVAEAEAEVRAVDSDFLFVLADVDEPEPDCLETLLRAQSVSGADVVTCALGSSSDGPVSLFLGEARELGVIGNYYGLVNLCRRDRVDQVRAAEHSEWLTLASLSLAGGQVVSVPRPLVRTSRRAE